eukprot:4802329-Heterocapsa_arctica.AAC.1
MEPNLGDHTLVPIVIAPVLLPIGPGLVGRHFHAIVEKTNRDQAESKPPEDPALPPVPDLP